METVLEDWMRQYTNLHPLCQAIARRRISGRSWYEWERLAGAHPKKWRKGRIYTQEQTQLLLCLAWLRHLYPKKKVTYSSLREYWRSNEYKIWEVYDAIAKAHNEPSQPSEPEEKLIPLTEVKKCCDAVFGRTLSRDCWGKWRRHIGVGGRIKEVPEGAAALLVFIACWRHDNYKVRLPSVNRLIYLMEDASRRSMTITSSSSDTQFRQWNKTGCSGKDLPKYLAAWGLKVSPFTLYSWGGYSTRKHYSVSELRTFVERARRTRCAGIAV